MQRRVRKRAAHVGSGWRGGGGRGGGGGLRGLALRLQRQQRLADLLVAHAQVQLLLPQLSEQRLDRPPGQLQEV